MKQTTSKILLLGWLLITPAMANDIYIQQSGDNLDLDITQDGQNNVVGTSGTAVSLTGDSMTLAITQTGDANEISAIINGDTYTGTINLTGGMNTVDLTCATANCDNVTMTINVTGDSADVTVDLGSTADASDFTGTIDISSAATETFILTANGTAANVDIDITNSLGSIGNTATYSITGDGDLNGHSLTHSHTGDGAVINITQSGINDTVIDLTTSGDNHTIDILQTD
jgi:hypothetical protein